MQRGCLLGLAILVMVLAGGQSQVTPPTQTLMTTVDTSTTQTLMTTVDTSTTQTLMTTVDTSTTQTLMTTVDTSTQTPSSTHRLRVQPTVSTPIIIEDCPTEDIVEFTGEPGRYISWAEPYAEGQIEREKNEELGSSSGIYLNVGDSFEVVYTFTDLNNRNNKAICAFNVSVQPQCSNSEEIACSNGVCLPRNTLCDGYNDCGDGSRVDELYGEGCGFPRGSCDDSVFVTACSQLSSQINATGAETRENSSTILRYTAPSDATSNTFLFGINLQLNNLVNIGEAGLERATAFITVNLTESKQTDTVRIFLSPRSSLVQREFRVPLRVLPNEEILLSIEYTDNVLTNPTMFPVQTPCLDCVSVNFTTFVSGCGDATCLSQYNNWKTEVIGLVGTSSAQCGIPERNNLYDELYMSCFSPPEFSFISPSQYSFVEDMVRIRCEASGQLATLVEWYDSEMLLVASGLGVAVHSLFVSEQEQSFVCVLDKIVRSEQAVIVAAWNDECDQLFRERESFLGEQSSDCVVQGSRPGSQVDQSLYVFFQGPNEFAFELRLSSLGGNQMSEGSSPPNAAAPGQVSILPPVRVTFEEDFIRPSRRKRNIIQTIIYSRDYEGVYVSQYDDTVFKLDPPVLLNQSKTISASVVFLNQPTEGEQQGSLQGQVSVSTIGCMNSSDSICSGHFNAWSRKQQEFEATGCSSEPNYALEAYRVCQNFATTEPVITNPPRSVEVNSTSIDNSLPTTLVCEIENAVEYNWYKVAPTPRRQLVKSGNVLPFENIDDLDQGFYICTGTGGGLFMDRTVETKPALLTIAGASIFKVTVRLVMNFTADLLDQDSRAFRDNKVILQEQFMRQFLESPTGIPNIEVIAFRPGSVITDLIMYFQQSNLQDSELGNQIYLALAQANNSLFRLSLVPENTTVLNIGSCVQSSVVAGSRNLTFPQTRIEQTAQTVEQCSSLSFRAGKPLATRECVGDLMTEAEWLEPVIIDCSEGGDVNNLLDGLANVEVTPENVIEIAMETLSLSSNYSDIDETGIKAIAEILNNIVTVETVSKSPSPEIAADIVEIVSNVQEVDQETFDNLGDDTSPSLIILALETYITALQMSDYPANITEIQDNIAVVAVVIPQQSLQTGLGFASITQGSGLGSLKTEDISIYYEPNSIPVAEVKSSILVPAAVLDYVTPGETVPISFFLYQTSKLFRSPSLQEAKDPAKLFRRAVGSRVIAATVEGIKIENLPMDQPVISAFLPLNVSGPDEMINGSQCVFWDFSLNDGFGDWSSEGCSKALVNNSRTVCHCDHLTSFAVIVDIYGNQENTVLSIISKIGCAVSVIALLITIITYLYIKKLRTKRPQQILICFSFSLLGLYLVFLTGIEATEPAVGCTIVAVLIHFFTLASVAWMAVEATNMYFLFVKVLNANVSHFMLIACATAWGLPLLIVVIILAVDHTNYGTADYCFLKPGNAFYFGQILIIGLVLLFNFVIFTLVMRTLTCARKGLNSTSDRGKRQETLRRLQNAMAISVLLGLTWVFGLLSLIETANFVFQIFFCIFNSLQGLMIFILFCLRQQEIRKAWMAFFKCGDDRKAKYSNTAGVKSRGNTETNTQGTIPLTNQSTKSTS
ncbi:uncharacterized protein LOC117306763 isoform X2 [Asterias rubens]|uniref:uncharacterized protein LOC117306763 isoform X2 n=1 Tax=Asterias rubens TaxID=7604 RepID=UPI001454F0BA|nr:uncharacterized protein LOC117306763 isoform X2 [Asterias rubens]